MTRLLTPSEAELVSDAIGALCRTYTDEGIAVWLRGAKRTLDGKSPLDLIAEGRADEFASAVEALGDWERPTPVVTQERT